MGAAAEGVQAGWSATLPDMAVVAIEPGSSAAQGSMARRAPTRGCTRAGADQRSAHARAANMSGAAPVNARSARRRLAPDSAGHVGAEAGAVAQRARLAIGREVRIGDRSEAISTARRDVYMIENAYALCSDWPGTQSGHSTASGGPGQTCFWVAE